MGIGRFTAWYFSTARDILARGLIRLGVTPNALTIFGTILTIAAAVCLATGVKLCNGNAVDFHWWGKSHRFFSLAALLMFGCSACDMLDGAVARIGNLKTRFGGFLDSTLDRVGDGAIWGGLAIGYATLDTPNLTFILLCLMGSLSAFLISYTKCRAEDFIEDCAVGFWKRGERFAAVLISAIACNPGAMVLLLGVTAYFTWIRRVTFTRNSLKGKNPSSDPRTGKSFLEKIQPWCYPRMTIQCDMATIGNILILIFLRFDTAQWDLLRDWALS